MRWRGKGREKREREDNIVKIDSNSRQSTYLYINFHHCMTSWSFSNCSHIFWILYVPSEIHIISLSSILIVKIVKLILVIILSERVIVVILIIKIVVIISIIVIIVIIEIIVVITIIIVKVIIIIMAHVLRIEYRKSVS